MRINGGWVLGLGVPVIVASITYLGHTALGFPSLEAALLGLIVTLGLYTLYLSQELRSREQGLRQEVSDLEARLVTTSKGQADSEAKLSLLIEHARRLSAEPRPASASDLDVMGSLLRELAEAISAQESAVQVISQKIAVIQAPAPVYYAPPIPEPQPQPVWQPPPPPPPVAAQPTVSQPVASPRVAAAREAARAAIRQDARPVTPPQLAAAEAPAPRIGLDRASFIPLRSTLPPAPPPITPETRQLLDVIDNDRLELFLQPIVSLPQRKTRLYEASLRPLDIKDRVLMPTDLRDAAAIGGLSIKLDRGMIGRVLRLIKVFKQRGREAAIMATISPAALADAEISEMLRRFIAEDAELAASLILSFTQIGLRTLGPIEATMLDDLSKIGVRIAMVEALDLRLNPQDLSDRGIRYVKVAAARLIEATQDEDLTLEIHAADLGGLLARHGISLVADSITNEQTVLDTLDFVIPLAQGDLFSPPRQVRAEILDQAVAGAANAQGGQNGVSETEPRVSFRSLLRRASV